MLCPQCKSGQIVSETGQCDRCGFAPRGAAPPAPAMVEEVERMVARQLGQDYHLEGLLGRGGMSLVYLAREKELNRLVALKVLPLQLAFDADAVERFKREAKIAASLDHPHILPVFRVGATSTFMWYSTKYVSGRPLDEVVRQAGRLPLDACLDIVGQVASALNYAHHRGIVHRDIKPQNILLEDDGWVWVCDFGIAKAFGSAPLTQTGGTMGTPGYMSPEQCLGQAVDGRSDQYSLALVTYECLAGTPPFKSDSFGEMIHKAVSEPAPRLTNVLPDAPPDVAEALLKAMSKKPDERFPDVVGLVEAMGGRVIQRGPVSRIDLILEPLPLREPTPVTGEFAAIEETGELAVHAPPRRRFIGYVLAAAVALAAAGALASPWSPLKAPQSRVAAPPLSSPGPTDNVGAPSNEGAGTTVTPQPAAGGTTTSEPGAPAPPPRREPATDPRTTRQAESTARETTPTRAAPPPSETADVQLQVFASPLAELLVDDRFLGYTNRPLTVPLTLGRHQLRIQRDGYEPFDSTVTVIRGQPITITGIVLRPVSP